MKRTGHHRNADVGLRTSDIPAPLLVAVACGGLVAEAVGVPVVSVVAIVGVVIWVFHRLDDAWAAADAKADHLAVVADHLGWDSPRGASGVPLRWVVAMLRWVVPVALVIMRIAVALVALVAIDLPAVSSGASRRTTFVVIAATVAIATVAGVAGVIRAARSLGD